MLEGIVYLEVRNFGSTETLYPYSVFHLSKAFSEYLLRITKLPITNNTTSFFRRGLHLHVVCAAAFWGKIGA